MEEALKRLTAHKGVTQAVIVNSDGIPIRTVPAAMEPKDATMFPAVLLPVVQKSKQMVAALAKLEGIDNSFNSIRLRSKKNEILVYPEVRTRARDREGEAVAPNSAPWRREETRALALHMLRVVRGGADLALARPLPSPLCGAIPMTHMPRHSGRVCAPSHRRKSTPSSLCRARRSERGAAPHDR